MRKMHTLLVIITFISISLVFTGDRIAQAHDNLFRNMGPSNINPADYQERPDNRNIAVDESYTVSGYVEPDVNSSDSNYKEGFKVDVIGTDSNSLTDITGYFQIHGIKSSPYTLKFSKPAYLSREIVSLGDAILGSQNQPVEMWAGDVLQDDIINMGDVMETAKAFNSVFGDNKYNTLVDLNQDKAVNMSDIMIIVKHFNKSAADYPPVAISTPSPTITPESTLTPIPTPTTVIQNQKILAGSLIQPWLASGWNTSNFATEFEYMKSVKMDHLVWQWTVDSKNKWTYYTNTKLNGFTPYNTNDAVGISLEKAKQKGMKVWLGLNWTDDWWQKYASDKTWLENEFNLSKNIASELWNLYSAQYHDTIAGFYLTMEMDNVNFMTQTTQENMKTVYKDVADYIHRNMNKPVMVAPFFNEKMGQNASTYAAMWKNILTAAPIDIIALQDGIGVDHCTVQTVGNWFAEMKKAIVAARPSTELWSDLETCTPSFTPAQISRVIQQINAEYSYVNKITSFSFNHYDSPQQGHTTEYNAYKGYVDSLR